MSFTSAVSAGMIVNGELVSGGIGAGITDQIIYDGGIANSTTVVDYGANQYVSSGGIANFTIINSEGFQEIYNGGVANSATINLGGDQYISSGGTASSTIIASPEANQRVYDSGTAIDTIISSGGGQYVYSGGTANSTTINSDGIQYVSSGGTVTNVSINSGGSQLVSSGGILNGEIDVDGGILITSATVNMAGSGDEVNLFDNADLSSATISLTGGGDLNIFGVSNDAGNISISGGGALNFDITEFTSSNTSVMLTSIADISTSSINITIDSSSFSGDSSYALAAGDSADAFNGTVISVYDGESNLGDLTLSNSISNGDFSYSLDIDENNLVFYVGGAADIEDPPSTTVTKITASDGAEWDLFGFGDSVAIEGDNIVIGAKYDDDNGYRSGSAYIYHWNGTAYEETKLTASDGTEWDLFGHSVAIDDGTILISARGDSDDGREAGSAYVYRWNGTAYDEVKLTASDVAEFDYFGSSVAIDGDNIVIAARNDDDKGDHSGSAYVYRWNGSAYDEIKLTASDGAVDDRFGHSVAIDGDNIVIGAKYDDDNGLDSGSVYIYRWNGTSYDETKLSASDGAEYDSFGSSVAIDGDNIVIGAGDGDDPFNLSDSGSAYVYRWDGTAYNEIKLTPFYRTGFAHLSSDAYFGSSVAIDGDNIVIGAKDSSSAYIYRWNGTAYDAVKLTSDGIELDLFDGGFGSSVAIDGDNIVIGADGMGMNSGSAYIFDLNDILSVPTGLQQAVSESSVALDWADSSGATKYNIQVDDNNDFSGYGSDDWSTDSNIVLEGTADGVYSWRVQAFNDYGYSDWTQGGSFIIDTFVSNPDGMTTDIDGDDVTLNWDAVSDVSGILRYEYYLYGNDPFSDPIFQGETSDTTFSVSDLADGTYSWEVQAVDNADNVSFSWSQESFIIDTQAPSAPTGFTYTVTGDSITGDWDDSADASGIQKYEMQGSDSNDFPAEFTDVYITTSSNITVNDLEDGVYFYRVRAQDNAGNWSAWSTTESFTVESSTGTFVCGDFYGDGKADILWRNQSDGTVGMWGDGVQSQWNDCGIADINAWEIVGVGDFYNDGKSDILWRNQSDGNVGMWGDGVQSQWNDCGVTDVSNWEIVGVGDFYNDSKDDVLWRNQSDGTVGMWGDGVQSQWNNCGIADINSWEIVGVGDFYDDGKSDVLWRNQSTGNVGMWGDGVQSNWNDCGVTDVNNWEIVGVGDFYNDGKDDVLWRNISDGTVGMWGDGVQSQWNNCGIADINSWEIVGVGDFYNDGRDDVLWRNQSTGDVGMWGDGVQSNWNDFGSADINTWAIC